MNYILKRDYNVNITFKNINYKEYYIKVYNIFELNEKSIKKLPIMFNPFDIKKIMNNSRILSEGIIYITCLIQDIFIKILKLIHKIHEIDNINITENYVFTIIKNNIDLKFMFSNINNEKINNNHKINYISNKYNNKKISKFKINFDIKNYIQKLYTKIISFIFKKIFNYNKSI